MSVDLRILAFWAVVMFGIQSVSGSAAALWFAVGWIGASLFAMWEAGGTKNERENSAPKGENHEGEVT